MSGANVLEIPHFECTEDAIRFGQHITRDQFIYLCGARAAMREIFDELRTCFGESIANLQLRGDLATRMQLIREALEMAPVHVRASIIGTGLTSEEEVFSPQTARQIGNALRGAADDERGAVAPKAEDWSHLDHFIPEAR